jgi:hypothetical protein
MADTYVFNPSLAAGKYLRSGVLSGRVPSAAVLDRIIQAEIDAKSRDFYRQRQFSEEKRARAQAQKNVEDTAAANRKANLVGQGTGLASTLLMARALRPKGTSLAPSTNALPPSTGTPGMEAAPEAVLPAVTTQTAPMATPAAAQGLTATNAAVPAMTTMGQSMAPYVAEAAPAAVSGTTSLATTTAPAAGASMVAPASTTGVGAGLTMGAYALPLAYAYAARAMRQGFGDLDKSYADANWWEKTTRAPLTSTANLGQYALNQALGVKGHTFLGKMTNLPGEIEDALYRPVDKLMDLDVGGAVKEVGRSIKSVAKKVADVFGF